MENMLLSSWKSIFCNNICWIHLFLNIWAQSREIKKSTQNIYIVFRIPKSCIGIGIWNFWFLKINSASNSNSNPPSQKYICKVPPKLLARHTTSLLHRIGRREEREDKKSVKYSASPFGSERKWVEYGNVSVVVIDGGSPRGPYDLRSTFRSSFFNATLDDPLHPVLGRRAAHYSLRKEGRPKVCRGIWYAMVWCDE